MIVFIHINSNTICVGNHSNTIHYTTDPQREQIIASLAQDNFHGESKAYHSWTISNSQEDLKYVKLFEIGQEGKKIWKKHTPVCFSDLSDLVDLRLLSNRSNIQATDLVTKRPDLSQSVSKGN